MSKRLLIDATNPEETRVAVVRGNVLDEFDIEFAARRQIKGNVYLAKVTRVEPSLQAAFVEYGGNRHGFLSFNEIHPDYYQIPIADREKLVEAETAAEEVERSEDGEIVEEVGGDEIEEEAERRRRPSYRGYKIQEVIKRRQILLIQVVKEERGNKGAALTTYLSLAGRYCVLMPNTNRGGGISRKISNPKDRKRLKSVLDGLDIPEGIGVIVRTAGAERSKPEIKRDYDYLMKQWISIRELTLASTAPKQIYEEASLIKRSIRDLYSKEIDEILVEGDEGYRIAKDFMKTMIPSHAARVKPYKDNDIPILHRYQVESQIDAIHHPVCQLPSGGYIVLNSTEALVAIDVNSGRATRGRSIEETAYKTNLEAAEEVARQLRLRDLAGLIVIDFIDMEVSRNIHAVERKLKEALRTDRARIQVGRISHFGLLEMSRQRLRPSVTETATEICPACGGAGHIRSTEGTALHVLRAIEEEGIRQRGAKIALHVPTPVALYILNQKRKRLAEIEARYQFAVSVEADDSLIPPEYRLDRQRTASDATVDTAESTAVDEAVETVAGSKTDEDAPRKRRSRRRRSRGHDDSDTAMETTEARSPEEAVDEDSDGNEAKTAEAPQSGESEEEPKRRRRRGRRGGRRRSNRDAETGDAAISADGEQADTVSSAPEGGIAEPSQQAGPAPDYAPVAEADTGAEAAPAPDADQPDAVAGDAAEETPKPKRRRAPRRRRPAAKADESGTSADAAESGAAEPTVPETATPAEIPTGASADPLAAEVTAAEIPAPAEAPEPEPVMQDTPFPAEAPEPVMETVAAASPEEPEMQPADNGVVEAEAMQDRPKRAGWWQRIVN